MGQIELVNYALYLKPFNRVQIELSVLDSHTWNHLTMCKQINFDLFKNKIAYKPFT